MDSKKVAHWSIITASIGITVGVLLLSSVVAFSDVIVSDTMFIDNKFETTSGETYIQIWGIFKSVTGFLLIVGSLYIFKNEGE